MSRAPKRSTTFEREERRDLRDALAFQCEDDDIVSDEGRRSFIGYLYKRLLICSAPVHAFDVLGDPVRRRILELLASGERSSGAITEVIRSEFGISQPAVSQHLRVLREAGFATVRPDGPRRLYAVDPQPLRDVDAWLDRFRAFWTPHLDALASEIARGRRRGRLEDSPDERSRP